MAAAEDEPEKEKGSTSEIVQQDFFQEAKTLIARHYERINENKIQGPSINVFRNKHQKLKSSKYIPLKIKKKESFDVQEHQTALRSIGFSKELSKSETLEEPSRQQTYFKEPHISKIKEKYQCIDLFTKEQVKLRKIMIDIESVSKKMEKEKQQQPGKSRMVHSLEAFPILPALSLPPKISSITGFEREPGKTVYDWRGVVTTKSFHFPYESGRSFLKSSALYRDYFSKTFVKKEQQPIVPASKPGPR